MEGDIDVLRRFVLRNKINTTIASREYKEFPKKTLRRLWHYGYLKFEDVSFNVRKNGSSYTEIELHTSEYSSKYVKVTSLGLEKLMEEYPYFSSYYDNLNRMLLSEEAIKVLKEISN